MEKFNRELFMQVLESNVQMFNHSITIEAERMAANLTTSLMTENQTRQLAVDFFNFQLSKYLTNRLINKI